MCKIYEHSKSLEHLDYLEDEIGLKDPIELALERSSLGP